MAQDTQEQSAKELSVVIAFLKRRLIYRYGPEVASKWAPRQRTSDGTLDI